jgi:hypothetical protein
VLCWQVWALPGCEAARAAVQLNIRERHHEQRSQLVVRATCQSDEKMAKLHKRKCRSDDLHGNVGHAMNAHSLQAVVVNIACLAAACLALTGCSLGGAPSYSIFGAFFPAWLLCAAIGLAGSVALRGLVIASGIEEAVPFRLLVYTAFAAGIAVWLWMALFGVR